MLLGEAFNYINFFVPSCYPFKSPKTYAETVQFMLKEKFFLYFCFTVQYSYVYAALQISLCRMMLGLNPGPWQRFGLAVRHCNPRINYLLYDNA
jgi:hypothetical protein